MQINMLNALLQRAALVLFVVAVLLAANENLRAQAVANGIPLTRRNDPYYGPLDPPGAALSVNGLPVPGGELDPSMVFAGPQNAFSPYVGYGPYYGYGPRWSGAPWGGYGWGYPAPYYRPPGVPIGYGGVWGYRYPRGLYLPGYRYGENWCGPFAGFYGPAQAIPGYHSYAPFAPLPFTAPNDLPAPQAVVPGAGSEAVPGKAVPKSAPAEGP